MNRLAFALAAALLSGAAYAQETAVKPPRKQEEKTPPKTDLEPVTRTEEAEEEHAPHYITAYGHHIEKGELEVMLSVDFNSPSSARREKGWEDFFSQMLMIEYSPASQLAFELMLEGFEDVGTGEGAFTGYRLEARYRLFERPVPLNPTLYVEYEDLDPRTRYKMEVSGWIRPPYEEAEEESGRERILESRLILSQDFGPWNVALNWLNETDLVGGTTAFGYMVGVFRRFADCEECREKKDAPFLQVMGLGLELYGALGDTKSFDFVPHRQEHYLQPSMSLHVAGKTMVTLGFALGMTDASDDMVRLMIGWNF